MTQELLARAVGGDLVATARLITSIERGEVPDPVMDEVLRLAGGADVIGITGTPGAGKSTLVAALIEHLRGEGRRVAVLAVDPSSPLTGGAVLGDRVRMAALATHPDVFVRSMATRGELGGLARAAPAAVRLLDAVGMDVVIVETVGVGQSEVAVAATADCVVLVVAPGGGDAVQAMKAGVLEIADVIVVNKADLPGADRARTELAAALRVRPAGRPVPEVLSAQADVGAGVSALAAHVGGTIAARRRTGALRSRRAEQLRRETLERAGRVVQRRLLECPERWLDAQLLEALASSARDPAGLGDAIAERVLERAARSSGAS